MKRVPRCVIIAGPNGAGKTRFAREYLPHEAGVLHFVNAHLIAAGLSPLRPSLEALAAGRLMLREIERMASARESFTFESTLAGRSYLSRIRRWRADGYRIEILFLRLDSPSLVLARIHARVKQGGHPGSRIDVLRRFDRSRENFAHEYRPLADAWSIYDNSGHHHYLLEQGP